MARPLEGVRVLDLSRLIPGPFASLVLRDLGAQVDKIEDAGAGDYLRYAGPQKAGVGLAFAALNRGKRSAVVDLKHDRGREAFLRLAGQYDVVLEQFRPGVLERLGLSHETLRERHPALIVCALTGYGQDGPYRDRAGHDLNYLARAGVLGLQGPAGQPPQVLAVQLADVSGGMWCAIAILAALRRRDATGEGEVLDVAMSEGVLGFATLGIAGALGGEARDRGDDLLSGGIAPYATYLSKDGVPMTLAALEPKFWMKFAAATGLEPDAEALLPGKHQAAWREKVAAVFAERTRAEWEAFAAEHDCCVEAVLAPTEIASDEHLEARGALSEVVTEGGPVPVFRTPVTPRDGDLPPPPDVGEHTRTIFTEAGFSDDEIEALLEAGAIREAKA